ncbi:MAG: hypothetical protein D6690_03730 [Nitrospirae bacterium]|nr:MAG: hypothetical protein D6690_03730 [Nitrospirota bacterium]
MNTNGWTKTWIGFGMAAGLCMGILGSEWTAVYAEDDPFRGRNATERHREGMALDQTNWKRPQSVFTWIAMARGYETPWDTVGRPGWMTDDAYVRPIDPGVSEFTPDTEEIYIVFEGQPLDAPGQFAAAWFEIGEDGTVAPEPIGQDVIELEMNQRYGYFIITPPAEGWKQGRYLVKIYYGSPGQRLHAANVVGTMEFTITDTPKNLSPS